MREAWVVTNDE